MTDQFATDYQSLARLLERYGLGDAARAIRELLAHVEERDRRIDELERSVAALGEELRGCDVCCLDDGAKPCGKCDECDPAAYDPELHA